MLTTMVAARSPLPGQNARASEVFLYQAVAQHLANAIRRGTFAAGERMPSLRQLAERHHISLATAVQVYRVLVEKKLIESRSRSGYYVRKQNVEQDLEPLPSQPVDVPERPVNIQIGFRFHDMISKPGLVSIGVTADPAPDLVPSKVIARFLGSVTRRNPTLGAIYSHALGNDDLRSQIASCMTDAGCYLSPDDIIVTSSCQESLGLALRAVARAGDTIAIESPTYIGIPHLLAFLDMKALEIPTHPRTGIDIDALQQALTRHPVKACIFMPACHNPLGASMPEKNKRRLVDLLAKEGIPLIEDDAMGGLTFEQPRPKAAKAYDRDGNVLYCGSFSKILGPGQRIGWIAPGRYKDPVIYSKTVLTSLSSPVWQHLAIANYLAGGSYARTVSRAVRAYKKRVMLMREWVLGYFPAGTRVTRPQGGFILWVELPESIDVQVLLKSALAKGMAFSPGLFFSPSGGYTHHIRLSAGGSIAWDRMESTLAALGKLANNVH
jgi:DNA-binding transcriptional MocR family regulator